MKLLRTSIARLAIAAALSLAAQAQSQHPGLVLISIDGMHPDNVLQADKYRLKIPNLRRILRDGVHATSVRGVLPTVTYPSHTTMLTGVSPQKHGIYNNVTFDPFGKNMNGWYWYAEDIRVPTLWQAAANAGYIVGSISWPVSAGALGVRYGIPEYWRAMSTDDDMKLLRAISSPGLLKELKPIAGDYILDLDDAIPGDWARTRYAAAIIREKHARLMTIHYAAFDHLEHAYGPYSPEAFATLEEIDKMVAELEKTIRAEDPNSYVCVVSDHGFARTEHELNINVAFVNAGLMKPNPDKPAGKKGSVLEWRAEPWTTGGGAAIMLANPNDTATLQTVEALLKKLAADPNNGIAKVLDRAAIAKLGGAPNAAFFVDMQPNFSVGSATSGPLVKLTKPKGTHGFSPEHPELQASFFLTGPGIRKGLDLGAIDMRSIAPTLAKLLGVPLPSADLPALPVQ